MHYAHTKKLPNGTIAPKDQWEPLFTPFSHIPREKNNPKPNSSESFRYIYSIDFNPLSLYRAKVVEKEPLPSLGGIEPRFIEFRHSNQNPLEAAVTPNQHPFFTST